MGTKDGRRLDEAGQEQGRGGVHRAERERIDLEVQRLAQRLLPQSAAIAAVVTTQLVAAVPEVLPPSVPAALDNVRESNEQNVGAVLSTLAFGMTPRAVEPPLGTIKVLRQLVAAGVDMPVVLRAYRHAHIYTWNAWLEFVHGQDLEPALLAGVLEDSSRRVFDYFDAGATQYVIRHRQEFPGLAGGVTRRRMLEDVLAGEVLDVAHARHQLGYDLSGHHLALVVAPLVDPAGATAAAHLVSTSGHGLQVLVQPQGDGVIWLWLASRQPLDDRQLASVRDLPFADVVVGMGEPGRGLEGFRVSHLQAERALRVARLRAVPVVGVVRHRDVEQLTLLTADPVHAREFAARRLGPLAERTEGAARTRTTLRAYLELGCNKARVSQSLGIHQKTVAYRLASAEALLGHPVSEGVTDLAAALLIDLALHGE